MGQTPAVVRSDTIMRGKHSYHESVRNRQRRSFGDQLDGENPKPQLKVAPNNVLLPI